MAVPLPLVLAAFDVTMRFVTDLALQYSRGELSAEEYEERVAAILQRSKTNVVRAHDAWDRAVAGKQT